MVKRGFLVVAGLIGFCFPLAAQQKSSPEQTTVLPLSGPDTLALYQLVILSKADSSTLVRDLPMLNLLDKHWLPVSTAMARMGMAELDLFPAELPGADEAPNGKVATKSQSRTDGKDLAMDGKDYDAMTRARSNPLYYSGEVGFLYRPRDRRGERRHQTDLYYWRSRRRKHSHHRWRIV